MKKILIVLIISISLLSCNQSKFTYKENIIISQIKMNYPLTIRADTVDNKIFRIHFRVPFEITSRTKEPRYIYDISYFYHQLDKGSNLDGWFGSFLIYNLNNEFATESGVLKNKKINKNNPQYIYIYTAHDIDPKEQTQLELKGYLEEIRRLHTDTLAISFSKFKNDHPELVKSLLDGDSISILIEKIVDKKFYDEKNDTIIKLPIKY